MESLLVKPVVKYGNSSCVILPKAWRNGQVRIELISKPENITKDIFEILKPSLAEISGIYLVGSYARNEETIDSDIDILVITESENKKIRKGKYEILLISRKNIEKTLRRNILPLLPMLKEAKTILNDNLIKKYRNIKVNTENIKWHIDSTASALKVQNEFLSLAKIEKEKISDGIMYSLVLRLRETYIIDCLKKNRIAKNTEIKKLIRELTNSEGSYQAYMRYKSNKKEQKIIDVKVAEKIYNYIKNKIEEQKE